MYCGEAFSKRLLPMHFRALVFLLLSSVSVTAAAQSHRCSSGGQTYFSDRPCNGETKLQAYGPARTSAQSTPTLRDPPRAQEHVKYLGSGCASISEAIRTGPSRGVRGDVIQGLHEEYRQKCSMEEQDARAQVQRDNGLQRQTQVAQREGSLSERQQAKERADRCNGMRDVISLKRKREGELNAKEVDALRTLEKTYNEVCITR